jgi:hypothetical protein
MPHLSAQKRDALFGRPYRVLTGGQLELCPRWRADCLVRVRFRGVEYSVHRRARAPFLRLVEAWDRAGLLRLVLTLDKIWEWDTCVRGTRLKRHCHGNAFDVNASFNPIGRTAYAGVGGTLPLLELARELGWACGADRGPVARHFELAQVD